MVRDSVQLETVVNTISHEYLLEFTSEYGISEMLHPELPGPGDRIVDFPEGKVATLQEQVSGEEKLKAAFEEFKQYEDDRVKQRYAELDARLDALSIDFDEELYPHMLTAIAGRRWVIGHGLRLAMMKCAKSLEMRQAFADVVSAGVAKGMSEDLKHGVEHGRTQLELESIEAYDPEAEAKFVAALQSLKDLKFSLLDQLESLKDASMDYILCSMGVFAIAQRLVYSVEDTESIAARVATRLCGGPRTRMHGIWLFVNKHNMYNKLNCMHDNE
nr:hypothetical protein [Tanacetum cinerariifolium]